MPDEGCSPLAVRRADPRPAWTHAGSDTCWPRAGYRNRARQSNDDADAKAGQARPGSWSTRWHASPALQRVFTGRIPASPGLSLGSVPAGLVLVVEIVLVGPRATPPPQPCPHTPDPVQHGQPPCSGPLSSCQNQQQEKHRNVISRGTTGPHQGHIPPERQGQHRSPAGGQRPSSAALFSQHRRSFDHPGSLSHGGSQGLKSPCLLPSSSSERRRSSRPAAGRPKRVCSGWWRHRRRRSPWGLCCSGSASGWSSRWCCWRPGPQTAERDAEAITFDPAATCPAPPWSSAATPWPATGLAI